MNIRCKVGRHVFGAMYFFSVFDLSPRHTCKKTGCLHQFIQKVVQFMSIPCETDQNLVCLYNLVCIDGSCGLRLVLPGHSLFHRSNRVYNTIG